MKITRQAKVYSANSQLVANTIQTVLEKAGIPAVLTISHNGSFMDVMVPAEFVFDASGLLNPECPSGELFWVASK